jgi:hypothetical protein
MGEKNGRTVDFKTWKADHKLKFNCKQIIENGNLEKI